MNKTIQNLLAIGGAALVLVMLACGVKFLVVKQPVPVYNISVPLTVQPEAGAAGLVGASGGDGSHTKKLTVAETLDVGGAVTLGTTTITGGQTISTGGMTITAGGLTVTAGNTRLPSLVHTGAIAAFTVTSTATAANVCDSPVWTMTPVTTTPTLTLPTTSSLFASCLTTDGDSKSFSIHNLSAVTNTIFAAGTGGTLKWNLASTTINAAVSARVTIDRVSATAYRATVSLHPN